MILYNHVSVPNQYSHLTQNKYIIDSNYNICSEIIKIFPVGTVIKKQTGYICVSINLTVLCEMYIHFVKYPNHGKMKCRKTERSTFCSKGTRAIRYQCTQFRYTCIFFL